MTTYTITAEPTYGARNERFTEENGWTLSDRVPKIGDEVEITGSYTLAAPDRDGDVQIRRVGSTQVGGFYVRASALTRKPEPSSTVSLVALDWLEANGVAVTRDRLVSLSALIAA